MTPLVDIHRVIQKRLRSDVQSMQAYAVQDSKGLIKLDAMENPYRLSEALQKELGARLGAVALNRYPAERIADLKQALANYVQLPAGFSLMLGNGSDELISLLAMACDRPVAADASRPCILAPVPGFVMYAMSAQLQGMDFVGVPLTADFELDAATMLQTIAERQPALTYLAYPNNPTANLWDAAVIAKIIAACAAVQGLVVIDEAYQPFAGTSYWDTVRASPERYAHVLLMRTLSKFGLAGVRLGYMMGATALVSEIDKVRPPYNISSLNAECALFALEHQAVFAEQAEMICAERERLLVALASLAGAQVYPSQANMILLRVADAGKTFAFLKSEGVLVKNVSALHPLLANCLRLTVGTAEENQRCVDALRKALAA